MKLDVAHKHLGYIIEGVTVAEAEDLLEVIVAAFRGCTVVAVCFVAGAILHLRSDFLDFVRSVTLH